MKHFVLASICVLILVACFAGEHACGQQTKRDALRYDEGGTLKITLDVPAAQRVKASEEVRAFVWEHWNEHRRGRLQMITQSIEGQISFQKIFIEPDSKGNWCIRDEAEVDVHKGAYPAKPQTRIDEYDELRRVDKNSGQIIPASRKCSEGTYRLLLINSSRGVQWFF